jgi:hypothetical protein
MRTLQIDRIAVSMDEYLSRGAMHHQKDKEVSEMRWLVVGCCRFLRLIMAGRQSSMLVNSWFKRVMIRINATAMQQSSSPLVLQEIKSINTRISAVIAFRHGRFDSKRRWLST